MNTVTVEFVMWNRRVGPLHNHAYVVVQVDDAGQRWLHLPDTDAEKAMPVIDYGRKVCAELGAEWVEPPPWVPGAVDDFTDVTDNGNGLIPGCIYRQRKPRRRVAA